ncbi:MAG: DUF1501 domain-containing protein [Bacteroidetes bacterium]|nr:MAG: DUF1501 domain-containing protein [Bacteroidota bacterium]
MSKKHISRRHFLGTASCAALGTTTFFNTLLNLGMTNALAAPRGFRNNDYRALVCILLAGGNDSYNMLVPTNTASYNAYAASRSNLALLQGDLLPLNYTDGQGQTFGLHPAMPEVQTLFNSGKLALIANAGTLVQPTTKAQAQNETVPLPKGLLSHADQAQQWQTSLPDSRDAQGWGGRMADILSSLNTNQDISMSISLGGTNVFQTGQQSTEFAIQNSGTGSVGIHVYESQTWYDQLIRGGVDSLLNQQYQDIFKQTYRDKVRDAQDTHEVFSGALAAVPPFATSFSNNPLSRDLHMVARTIAAQNALGMSRQTFFVQFGGWDHHDEVLDNQMAMLAVVSAALSEFQAAMEEIAMDDCVTTFTVSDFARTLTSNGNGSDHAWGGNALVMGADVNGGVIYGEYPDLALGSGLELGNGIILPTTATDLYFAELAMWMGVSHADLPYLLPNLGNFYTIGGPPPLGFMNI